MVSRLGWSLRPYYFPSAYSASKYTANAPTPNPSPGRLAAYRDLIAKGPFVRHASLLSA